MKTLQSNYTTPEQSKILLELGLPADSADCYLNGDSVIMLNGKTFQENYNEDLDLARLHLAEYPHYIPCWSVGRLIEINNMCYTSLVEQEYYIKMKDCNIDYMVNLFKLAINIMDFSKLEE